MASPTIETRLVAAEKQLAAAEALRITLEKRLAAVEDAQKIPAAPISPKDAAAALAAGVALSDSIRALLREIRFSDRQAKS